MGGTLQYSTVLRKVDYLLQDKVDDLIQNYVKGIGWKLCYRGRKWRSVTEGG